MLIFKNEIFEIWELNFVEFEPNAYQIFYKIWIIVFNLSKSRVPRKTNTEFASVHPWFCLGYDLSPPPLRYRRRYSLSLLLRVSKEAKSLHLPLPVLPILQNIAYRFPTRTWTNCRKRKCISWKTWRNYIGRRDKMEWEKVEKVL